MTHKYFPMLNDICHHFENDGGCTFCGYKLQERTVSKEPVTLESAIAHFDDFASKNLGDIEKKGRLVVAPNGSWFTEVPKELRHHIYEYVDANMIPRLQYECRASLFNPEKAKSEVGAEAYAELRKSLKEIRPSHTVSLGLEVANDSDLKILNKGCTLEDYVIASAYIRGRGAKLCCNILIAPSGIEEPIKKVFETAKYAAEFLKAEEFLLMPCIPMKGARSYKDWKEGKWNPVSATAASEVYRRISLEYPLINIHYNSMRIFWFTGRYGQFRRASRKWSEKEKEAERKMVKRIADEVFL